MCTIEQALACDVFLVRFTQPGAVMREDSMDRWRMQANLLTGEVALQSWDYRTLDQRAASAGGSDASGMQLSARDVPGVYAYTSREHGQRLAERRRQALDVARQSATGAGTVRTMAPATRFTLDGEPASGGSGDFIATRLLHLMHNNLAAQMRSNIQRELGNAALQLLNDADLAQSRHASGATIGDDALLGAGSWAGAAFAIVDEEGTILAQGTVPENGRLPRVKMEEAQTLTLRLGDAQGAELIPLASNASESLVEDDDDVDDKEDDDDDEGDDQEGQGWSDLLSHRYFRETAAAVTNRRRFDLARRCHN